MTPENIEATLRDYILGLPAVQAQGIHTLDRRADFVEMGIFDSISLLEFVLHIEQRFSIKVPGEDVDPDNFGSLAAISAYLTARSDFA